MPHFREIHPANTSLIIPVVKINNYLTQTNTLIPLYSKVDLDCSQYNLRLRSFSSKAEKMN